jgi:predicted metalloprotease with PDZ domain
MSRYVFLTTAVGEGYGGLEHRASTALMCSRSDLPRRGVTKITESYRGFLGLCSHEYFHTWNVKRLKPAAFAPYDLDRENYTSLLWVFEGFTSYYDDLMLLRAGVIDRDSYLELLGRTITSHLRTPGRHRQSVAESSFDAWIKYYRQDENSPNEVVSYYVKGSLVALCLDLHIRERTRGRKSLDDLMQLMWRRRGLSGEGVGEDEVEALAEEASGLKLGAFFDETVRGTAELPLARLLATQGIDMRLRPATGSNDKGGLAKAEKSVRQARASMGIRSRVDGKEIVVTHVLEGGAAQLAGVAAGDSIVAIDGLRPGTGGMDAVLALRRPGQVLQLRAFRRDEMHEFSVRLLAAPADTCELRVAGSRGTALRRGWLGKGNE